MAETLLIVEDDPSILKGLELNLSLEGFDVRTATDGATALALVDEVQPDLVILDIMLPEVNGFDVCRRLRSRGIDVPIIMLSAKATEVDKVMGLDLGADDYVVKPFGLDELIARINAHLRRDRKEPLTRVRFGDVDVDFSRARVTRAGESVEVTAQELALLRFMAERDGEVLTRETILAGAWGSEYFGTDRTVDNFINRLRRKLDTEDGSQHFQTVRGLGYRFKCEP